MSNLADRIFVVKAGSLLTAHSMLTEGTSLVVKSGIIDQIGQSIKYGNELPIVDFSGFTICPTFCDYHLHFSKKSLSDTEAIVKVLLQHGITEVWDGGDRDFTGLQCKKTFQSRIDVVTSSCALYQRGSYGSFLGIAVTSLDEAIYLVDHAAAKGVDTLKVINSGVVDPQTGGITKGGFQRDDLKRIIDYASKKGFPVICHANGDKAAMNAIDAGASTIVHGFFITPETLTKMVKNNVTFIPTIYAFYSLIDRYDDPKIQESIVQITEQHLHTVKMASDMGVRILAGSDSSPSFLPYGKGFAEEIRFLHKAGLSIEKVLLTATKKTLKRGNIADFLVLNGLKIHSIFIKGKKQIISSEAVP